MGRQLHRENSSIQFQDYHPGCLWGVLHILDYHHWKIVQNKKHHGRRHAICCSNPRTISMDHDTGEAQSLLDAEADNFLHPTKVTPTDKSIKVLITEEMSIEQNHNHWFLGLPPQSKFQRTNSIHHLEPSDYRLRKISTEWANPIIILHNNAKTSSSGLQFSSLEKTTGSLIARNKTCDFCDGVNVEGSLEQHQSSGKHGQVKSDKIVDAKQLNREIFQHQVKEYADVLEMFKVNKELFFKILRDPDDGVSRQFPGQQISNRKVKLTKSGSFPVSDTSPVRYLRPSTLEHKQNETWTFPKGEKLVSSTQVPKPDAVRYLKGYNDKTEASLFDHRVGSCIKHKTSFSSSSRLSNHQRWNRLVVDRLRDIKQRIKHAIKESKKERNKPNTDGFLQRGPSTCSQSTDGKEMLKSLENGTNQDVSDNFISCHEADGPDRNLNNCKLHRMRTASLEETMDGYAQLFESSFLREAKLPYSKTLKLRNEDNISSRERAPKFFRRISSLSYLESFCSLINEVVHDSEKAVSTEVDCNANIGSYSHSETKLSSFPVDADNYGPLDAVVESEFQKNVEKESDSNSSIEYSGGLIVSRVDEEIAGTGKLGEDTVEPANVTSIPQEDQKIDSPVNPTVGLVQPSLVSEPETRFPDDIVNTAECSISEGSESNPPGIHIDEADSSFVMQNASGEDSLPSLCSKVKHEKNNHLQHFELENNEPPFNYVRDVLQLSGFIENESLGRWYSLDQPLDPSLFKEMESCLHHEAQYSGQIGGNCDHQHLFNLINEVLLEMYQKSFTYFPRTFSFNHHIRPIPKGQRVLKEVWARICCYLSFRSELDRSLDNIVAQDFSKGDGWMTHQFETECVALELEESIFDELLDEVIYSCNS